MKTPKKSQTDASSISPAKLPRRCMTKPAASNHQDSNPKAPPVGGDVIIKPERDSKTTKPGRHSSAGAAKGDDDLMSQPVPDDKNENRNDQPVWQESFFNAQARWKKISDLELKNMEGKVQKLIELVQKRYATSREEAEKQVTLFFQKYLPNTLYSLTVNTKWSQQLGNAHDTWAKISKDELLHTQGNPQQLIDLVTRRYAISVHEAEAQVYVFLARNNAS